VTLHGEESRSETTASNKGNLSYGPCAPKEGEVAVIQRITSKEVDKNKKQVYLPCRLRQKHQGHVQEKCPPPKKKGQGRGKIGFVVSAQEL